MQEHLKLALSTFILEQELPHGDLTDAFSYGGMSYEGGQTKENVVYHGKMPTRDPFP